jgi:anaerobic ribonucleoside-triphosphate reductase activating protein
VLWLQGCTLGCPGCFNPETHPSSSGERWSMASAIDRIESVSLEVEGLTISGGEPLQQIIPLTAFLSRVRAATPLSIVAFTGFEWAEVQQMPAAPALLKIIDVLITGRYRQEQRVARGLAGSANKTLHFLTARYTLADFNTVPEAEIILSPGGKIALSGIDPLKWGGFADA